MVPRDQGLGENRRPLPEGVISRSNQPHHHQRPLDSREDAPTSGNARPGSISGATHARLPSIPRRKNIPDLSGHGPNPTAPDWYRYRATAEGKPEDVSEHNFRAGTPVDRQDLTRGGVHLRGAGGGGEGNVARLWSSRDVGEVDNDVAVAATAAPSFSGVSSRWEDGALRCPPRSPRGQGHSHVRPLRGKAHSRYCPGDDFVSSPGVRSMMGDGVGEGERGRGGKGSPKPPGFILHVEEVLRWLGVEGVTPEILRRAKRGLREQDVATKMWRALLHVCLLHHDATKREEKGDGPTEGVRDSPLLLAKVCSTSATRTISGRNLRSAGGVGPTSSGGGSSGRRKEEKCVGGVGAVDVPLNVAVETCGYLLARWGYRRKRFAEAIRTGDMLQTREILLALAWVITEARVFHAFEEARFVPPVPPPPSPPAHVPERGGKYDGNSSSGGAKSSQPCGLTPRIATPRFAEDSSGTSPWKLQSKGCTVSLPQRFPRDVSETPEIAELAEEAFLRCVSELEDGGEEVRWSGERGGTHEEELARALGAAREMMCCYGKLEGELRIVEGLEASRYKMLARMRSLHDQIQQQRRHNSFPSASAVTTAQTIKSSTTSSPPQHHHHYRQAANSAGSKEARATPFSLCLSTKSDEERHRVLSSVSEARAALERAEQDRLYVGRWCRWVSSAAVDASSPSRAPADTPPAAYSSRGNTSTGIDITAAAGRTVAGQEAGRSTECNPPGRRKGGDRKEKEAFAWKEIGDEPVSTVGDRHAVLASARRLQQRLESRIREVPSPNPIPATVWSALTKHTDQKPSGRPVIAAITSVMHPGVPELPSRQHQQQTPAREEEGSDFDSFGCVLRRLTDGVDSRLGQQEFVRALEKRRSPRSLGSLLEAGAEACDYIEPERTRYNGRLASHHHRRQKEHDGSTAILLDSDNAEVVQGDDTPKSRDGTFSPRVAVLSSPLSPSLPAAHRDLEEARRVHAERLAELLASCRGVMPFEPRGRAC